MTYVYVSVTQVTTIRVPIEVDGQDVEYLIEDAQEEALALVAGAEDIPDDWLIDEDSLVAEIEVDTHSPASRSYFNETGAFLPELHE